MELLNLLIDREPDQEIEVLLLSVGGSCDALVASISRQRPRRLIFFVSQQTGCLVEQAILPHLPEDYRYIGIEFVRASSGELLDDCYRVLRQEVPRILERWGLGWRDLRVDFSGGTKAMSAALVLTFADRGVPFSYVGQDDSNARGCGVDIVVQGQRQLFLVANPWRQLAQDRLKSALRAFNRHNFKAAMALLPEEETGDSLWDRVVASFRHITLGFSQWDRQQYGQAHQGLERGIRQLGLIADLAGLPSLQTFHQEVREVSEHLRACHKEWKALTVDYPSKRSPQALKGIDGLQIPRDLCAAALRRARGELDPEDGVLLLYAAIEKLAHGVLLIGHNIDNTRCSPEDLGDLAAGFQGRHEPDEEGHLKLPLLASYQLLEQRGDPYGARFFRERASLQRLFEARNNCWRIHGYSQVTDNTFNAVVGPALSFLGLTEEELVRFPLAELL